MSDPTSNLPETRAVPIDDLRAAEQAATPGPWFREYGDVVLADDDPRDVADGYDEPRSARVFRRAPHRDLRDPQAIADASLTVAMRNNLAALIDAADAVQRVRALHVPGDRPEEYYWADCTECPRDDQDGGSDCQGHMVICCQACWTTTDPDYGDMGCPVPYPCPTIRALEGPNR